MISKKNLWGELPKPETIRTPYTLLKEQASILSEITNGLLIGEVRRVFGKDQEFIFNIRIKAPALNDYTYSVVEVKYPIKLYPVIVKSLVVENFQRECSSEEEVENALGEILSSQEVKRVILALLSQIHEDIPKQ